MSGYARDSELLRRAEAVASDATLATPDQSFGQLVRLRAASTISGAAYETPLISPHSLIERERLRRRLVSRPHTSADVRPRLLTSYLNAIAHSLINAASP
jgi:hypothetical protein